MKLKIDDKMKELQKQIVTLDRRSNELLAEKKELSELKGKKRQLEQKIITKQDRYRPRISFTPSRVLKSPRLKFSSVKLVQLGLFHLFSLKQMEQNVVDMQTIEEQTKKKITVINSKKMAIVGELVALLMVCTNDPKPTNLCRTLRVEWFF